MKKNYFESMLPPEELAQVHYIPTISEFTDWIAEKWSGLPALSDLTRTITYAQMSSDIARKRTVLNNLGLAKGDRVAIMDNTTPELVEAFLAVTSAGYTAIILPVQLPTPAIQGSLKKFGAKAILYGEAFKEKIGDVNAKTVPITEQSDVESPAAKVDKDDPAAIFFTGGTTGAPKGAVLPHRAIMRGSFNGVYSPGHQLGCQTYACVLPLSHIFGLIRSTMSALYTGSKWVALPTIKDTIAKFPVIRPTCLVAVPGICEILLGLTKMYGVGFLGGRLKYIISGAATVPPKLIKEFDGLGISLFEGYGLTESANLTTGSIDVVEKPTSVGVVYPGQELKTVDGELWIRGDNVFLGYWGDPEKTAEALTPDGWLKTGDLVEFDDEGFMYIVGRIKNLIILPNGENVSPESIEEPFYKCDKLRDCLVKEDKDADGKSVIAIEILPRLDEFKDTPWEEVEKYFRDLVAQVNSSLPSTHRVTKITVRKEDFKRTGSLKVSRNQ